MLTLYGITKSFGNQPTLKHINLDVRPGEILCLLGPSGCGKTTLLRVIAGLEAVDSGTVRLQGQIINDMPVHKRGFGFVFQNFALFPHMNVEQNVRFGMRMQRKPKQEQNKRVQEVLELVGLSNFADRSVTQLSGGEQQRVALARSLAPNPRLLMFDEPLASIDASLKSRLRRDLRQLIKQIGLTAIYVTHDQQEAFAIGDRVAIMNDGKIEQIGTPETIYHRPETQFVAQFLGLKNILTPTEYEQITGYRINSEFVLLHPDGLFISETDGEISGKVIESTFMGHIYHIRIRTQHDHELEFRTKERVNVGEIIKLGMSDNYVLRLKG